MINVPGGKGTQRPHSHNIASRLPVHIFKGLRKWTLNVQLVIWHHECERCRHSEVGKKADEQRGHYADWDGTHGVFGLLTYDNIINRAVVSLVLKVGHTGFTREVLLYLLVVAMQSKPTNA